LTSGFAISNKSPRKRRLARAMTKYFTVSPTKAEMMKNPTLKSHRFACDVATMSNVQMQITDGARIDNITIAEGTHPHVLVK
jgi:hypothetical protein